MDYAVSVMPLFILGQVFPASPPVFVAPSCSPILKSVCVPEMCISCLHKNINPSC